MDVGSHKGGYLYTMRRCVGPSGAVVAFEPQPELVEFLARFKRAFHLDRMLIAPVGLSSHRGTLRMRRPPLHWGAATFDEFCFDDDQAEAFDVSVSADAVDAEIAERVTLPQRIQARLILVEPETGSAEGEEPAEGEEGEEEDPEPTQEQLDAARDEAQAALDRIEGGEAFATVATEVSDDFTRATGGELGWFEDGDAAYDEYFDALADAEAGDLVGPVETERGFAVLQLVARRERTTEGGLDALLEGQGVSDEAYRSYVREQLLIEGYLAHFRDEVIGASAPQRRVAEIVIRPLTAAAVPQERARHVLVQPDPELDDQAEATDEQWEAALAEAEEVAEQVRVEDADWFAVAEEHSDDTGSAPRGGDLGWYDPAASPYVEEFAAALEELEVGEISDPVRTDFGYHVIQKTGERESPEEQAAALVEELRANPEGFAEVAFSDEKIDVGGSRWVSMYLPVWLYSYYQENTRMLHYIAVNARTGETMGSVPVSQPRLIAAALTVGTVLEGIAGAILVASA